MTEAAYLREETKSSRLLPPRSIFKATAINHLSYGVRDYAETRDWYMDIFGMDCVYDDGRQASVAFGIPAAGDLHPEAGQAARSLLRSLGLLHRGFRRGAVHQALVKWGIDGVNWDGDFAWHARDDNGFLTQICAEAGVFPGAATRGWNTEGKIPSGAKASRPAKTGWRATGLNHVSYGVPDYRRTRDYYIDLFGMRIAFEDGIKCA